MPDTPRDIAAAHWDDIVIGTGVGGATLGHALARAGRRVLFLERGRATGAGTALRGDFPERRGDAGTPATRQDLLAGGRYPDEIVDLTEPARPRPFTPFIGTGTGGSSALYGMALERFFPADFEPAAQYPGASALPAHWPVTYAELSGFYAEAEALYGVRGGSDPLRTGPQGDFAAAPPLSPPNRELHDFLTARGLHPYALPMACAFTDGCRTCQSYLCARDCKRDSASACLQPALGRFGAALLDDCEVTRIEAGADSVRQLHCLVGGKPLNLSAARYFLAAGALESPRLLLASACADWPQGLGNRADLVGRHLMRHYVDLYAIFTRRRPAAGELIKQLAYNDFYQGEQGKLGSVQSFGYLPPAELLVADMQREIRRDAGTLPAALFGLVKPGVRAVLARVLARSVLLATTLEDLPSPDNRVTLAAGDAHRLAICYRPATGDADRIAQFRAVMAKTLAPYRYLLLRQADNNERLAHACGTCRFGTHADNSVCDPEHRVHGIDNLFIADSSVFPSSGGINPSLTIAALSLRLANRLTAQ